MLKYIKSIREELRISETDEKTLEMMKKNLLFRLSEYKGSILDNIHYNLKTNKVEYKHFNKLDLKVMFRELYNELTEDFVKDLNIETFLRKVNQVMLLQKRNTKSKVRRIFDDYIKSIDSRIEQIRTSPKHDVYFDEYDDDGEKSLLGRKKYEIEKYKIQVELLKLQEWVKKNNKKVAIVFEGRDAAGKGSTIKRFTEYLNPNGFNIVAMGIPTEEEKNNWFGRYEKHLPKEGEIVFFDRSWYNRAVVEPAMGYCTEEQYEDFMNNVIKWEEDLIRKDVILIKFWFSITKDKQLQRFNLRKQSPLKYWKFSPNDAKVLDKWEVIGNFKLQMFNKTSSKMSPWVIINSNDKKIGRLNAMRYVISKINYEGRDAEVGKFYKEVVNILS